jgi:transposase InsO family protein
MSDHGEHGEQAPAAPRVHCRLLCSAQWPATEAGRRGRGTGRPGQDGSRGRADRIRRDFTADAARTNTRWCGDITYIPTWEGWLYLATVLDIASRRVVGYALADHLRTELIADALSNAVAARDPEPGVIFHSDRGCQYTSAAYAALADDCQVTLSVGRTGQCWDNALAESFFSSLKASSSTPARGPPGPGPGERSWSTSPGTTAPDSTRHSDT